MTTNTTSAVAETTEPVAQANAGSTETLLDFESDAPLVACPLRNNGDEICEVCQ